MGLSLLVRLFLHIVVCVAYPFINHYISALYRYFFGFGTSRGVTLGLSMQLIFFVFVAVNMVVVVIKSFRIKLAVVVVMTALVFTYLVSEFPLRALALSILSGGLTLMAISVSRLLELRLGICR